MIRYRSLVFAVFFLIAMAGFANDKVISLATLEWPPYVGKDLRNYGFTAEIVATCLRMAGYEVAIKFMPWKRVLKYVKEGKFDAAFPAYYSEERAREFALSEPFAEGPLVFYKRKDRPIQFASLRELKRYKIGVVLGYVNTPEFDEADYLSKQTATNDIQNLRKLLKNRIDLAVIDLFTASYILKTTLPEGKALLEYLQPPLQEKPLYAAFSKNIDGYEQIRKDFDLSLKKLKKEGLLGGIMEKYDLR